jgi:hypothetical protein
MIQFSQFRRLFHISGQYVSLDVFLHSMLSIFVPLPNQLSRASIAKHDLDQRRLSFVIFHISKRNFENS